MVLDGRHLFDPQRMAACGIHYRAIGRGRQAGDAGDAGHAGPEGHADRPDHVGHPAHAGNAEGMAFGGDPAIKEPAASPLRRQEPVQ